jgi:hypothetical protein
VNPNQLVISFLAVVGFACGTLASYYFGFDVEGMILGDVSIQLIMWVIAAFFLSIPFFGYTAFLPLTVLGVLFKNFFVQYPEVSIFFLAPLLLSVYAGSVFGSKAWEALNEGKGFGGAKKPLVLLLVAIALAFALSYLPEFVEFSLIEL